MSVQLILMTVIRSVLTLMGPSLVPVTVDIHWIAVEEHAMVCELFTKNQCCVYIDLLLCLCI